MRRSIIFERQDYVLVDPGTAQKLLSGSADERQRALRVVYWLTHPMLKNF